MHAHIFQQILSSRDIGLAGGSPRDESVERRLKRVYVQDGNC